LELKCRYEGDYDCWKKELKDLPNFASTSVKSANLVIKPDKLEGKNNILQPNLTQTQ